MRVAKIHTIKSTLIVAAIMINAIHHMSRSTHREYRHGRAIWNAPLSQPHPHTVAFSTAVVQL
jgi:hypothetical protein